VRYQDWLPDIENELIRMSIPPCISAIGLTLFYVQSTYPTIKEPPSQLFGIPILSNFHIPRYYTVDDIIGRTCIYYAQEIGDEILRRGVVLGFVSPEVLENHLQKHKRSPRSNRTPMTAKTLTIRSPTMSKPPTTGLFRYIVGLFVLSLLILGMLLYDVAVCITIPVQTPPILC
jgi:hypothetical protein